MEIPSMDKYDEANDFMKGTFKQPYEERRTGRTTRMLGQAVAAACEGKTVFIAGKDATHSLDLVRNVKEALCMLGVPDALVRAYKGKEDFCGRSNVALFRDRSAKVSWAELKEERDIIATCNIAESTFKAPSNTDSILDGLSFPPAKLNEAGDAYEMRVGYSPYISDWASIKKRKPELQNVFADLQKVVNTAVSNLARNVLETSVPKFLVPKEDSPATPAACDCGALKARTTHADWCSTKL